MELQEEVVEEIKNILLDTRNVPLPGGHGFWCQELRRLHRAHALVPTVPERCAVAVIMLGLDDDYGRFFRRGWVPLALAWFNVNGTEDLSKRVGDLRWQYLFAAMCSLGATALPALHVLAKSAHAKIIDYRKTQRREERRKAADAVAGTPENTVTLLSVEYARQGIDSIQSAAERAWAAAANALGGSNRDVVLMLYAMHTLHASLGVPQYSMAAVGKERTDFYLYVADLIGAVHAPGCDVCEVAASVQQALLASPACGGKTPTTTFRLLEATLPSCFQPAHLHSGVPQRDTLNVRLAHDQAALKLLLAAHNLAEALADRLVDPLWWVELPDRARNVLEGHLILLDDIVKHGAARYKRDASRGDLPPNDDERAPRYAQLQPHNAFEHFQNLVKAAQLGVDQMKQRRSWTLRLTEQSCAICLRPATEAGTSR